MPEITTVKKRADFVRAAQSGFKKVTYNIVVQYLPHETAQETSEGKIRTGFTASRKTGNAVRRNRIKRRLRALAREILPEFFAEDGVRGGDVILIGRYRAAEAPFGELRRDLRYALKKLAQAAEVRDA